MEREALRKSPTEELIARMVMSWINKGWHFRYYEYMELGRRTVAITPPTLVGMSNLLINASASTGKTLMKGFT